MRYDKNLVIFLGHTEWYTFEVGVGYVPTDEAPPEAVKAMAEYNSYSFSDAEEWRKAFLVETNAVKSTFARMRQAK